MSDAPDRPPIEIPDFSRARVAVVGDVMLDRYWYGSTSRISPEAPVPVVHVQDVEERPGGAANVALNVAALGAQVSLAGVTGRDEAAATLERLLTARGVTCRLARASDHPTIAKLRVVSRHQQLLRLDFEQTVNGLPIEAMAAGGDPTLAGAAALVLSDYGKGTLARAQDWVAEGRRLGKPVIVDPKGRDFTRYRGASVVTPNLAELEVVVGECRDLEALVARGERLREELGLEALLVTRSEHGVTLLERGRPPLHLPAHTREVFDVTGAGDTVVAVLAAALAAGQGLPRATALANLAAGLVVTKLGTASVTVAELRAAIQGPEPVTRGRVDEETLVEQVVAARAAGERVVMTNGCFDILHAGHVAYLTEARGLGDRLVVAVNDDASVQRLKGRERPINALDHRLAVLSALACVDWVVPFAEDTPERIICRVRPDVLVKGGDYRPEQIAGGECVRAAGGQVVVLGYLPGCSTTEILEAAARR